jgi:hypothetical protein
MFENGSYLRRRKRFKLFKQQLNKSDEDEEEKCVRIQKPITKTSFLIDNLLANDTSTNTSFTTTSSSETKHPLQQLLYTTDFDLIRKLTLFNDVNGHHPQQLYW